MLLPSSSEQESKPQIIYPILGDHLNHTELKCAKLIPDQHSLLWGDTWRSSRPVNLIHHGIQRKRELSVWPNTENLHLYTRQSQKEGFQLVMIRIMNDNTLQTALQGEGELLSLASCTAEGQSTAEDKWTCMLWSKEMTVIKRPNIK